MKRVVATLSIGLVYAYASACCGVAASGQPVNFGDQSNIIVWNPETKTEHFVRNAFFDSKAKDFGFIAATPTTPELKEAKQDAFDILSGLKPKGGISSIGCGAAAESNMAAASPGGIDVLQEVEVGKYSAVTVRSDDPSAMVSYLSKNGYSTNSDIDEWIGFYTKKKWVFTAFKVREGKDGQSATGIIRMTFKTDEPFNPYYVPSSNSSNSDNPGTLKLYFVSVGTYSATVGHGANWIPASWNNQFNDSTPGSLGYALNLSEKELSKDMTVTYFEKRNWLEGAKDDLYFKKDSQNIPMSMGFIAVLGAGMWWFTKSRKAKLLGGN